ncbi:MAG: hypothetical protein BGO70_08090 [Bacteroidetes bacterium 43-93]|nr:hypothetical protein [Bacteroidota bacterium]OJW97728.1 MAG: hypothetical protein BGO70_08090 [Bacteroidetes bacterium 43-93]
MSAIRVSSIFFLLLMALGCRRESTYSVEPQKGTIAVNIDHVVDGQPLIWDSLIYKNAAGNRYSITRINYYISNIHFYRNRYDVLFVDSIFYVSAANIASCNFNITNVPSGPYDSVSFCIGLLPVRNASYSLPPTMDNVNMIWPDVMGGGYHFLKFEGHWLDSLGHVGGFAMHLGSNGYYSIAGAGFKMKIPPGSTDRLKLTMNMNEWFRNPNTYNLETDGVYSMGNATLMKKLAENGKDVFTAN